MFVYGRNSCHFNIIEQFYYDRSFNAALNQLFSFYSLCIFIHAKKFQLVFVSLFSVFALFHLYFVWFGLVWFDLVWLHLGMCQNQSKDYQQKSQYFACNSHFNCKFTKFHWIGANKSKQQHFVVHTFCVLLLTRLNRAASVCLLI